MSRRLGLIIGINQYQDPAFRPLHFAENDARALAQWLVNSKGGNWVPADVQLLQGHHGTRELVESLLTQLCLQVAQRDDLVVIYFAGHAFVDEQRGEGYFALANTRYADPSTGLRLSHLVDPLLARSPAAQILVILDCVQNGPRWAALRSSPYDFTPLFGAPLLNALQQQPDRLLLCSCRGNEQLAEMGEQSLGLFARRLIVGLCGPAIDPASGAVTLQQLMTFLSAVPSEQQRPSLYGQARAPLLLTGAQAPGAAPQTLAPPASVAPMPRSAPPASPGSASTMQQPRSQATTGAATAQLSPSAPDPRAAPSPVSDEQQRQQVAQLLSQAQQYVQAQQFGEALNLLAGVLRIAPQSTSALTLQCQVLGAMGRTQEALATVDRLLQTDPGNAAAWSMRAVLLSNAGNYQAALSDIERSLELNPNNPETYALKTNIMSRLATTQRSQGEQRPYVTPKRGGPFSFLLGAIVQMIAFILGIVGVALPIVRPGLPIYLGLALASIGMACLVVNAARGAYKYGLARLLFTLFICLLAAGGLAATYKFGYTKLLAELRVHATLLVPVLFLAAWLAVAATLPLLLALGGFIVGLPSRVRRRKLA